MTDNIHRKQFCDTAFINSRLFAHDYIQKKIDLTFARYQCLAEIKLN